MALGKSPAEIVASGEHQLLSAAPHWERVALGEIATVQNGFAFSSKHFTHVIGMPLIRIRDVRRDFTENRYSGGFDDEFVVRKGDLLIGMDGDFSAALWKGPDGLLNQRVCRVIQHTELYSFGFLFLVLQPYLNAINAETSSVTVKHLSSRTVADIPLPLPPLNEQKRIVEKIEELFSELDAGEESLRRARRQLGVYRQSLLKQAFEGKLTAKWREEHPDLLESSEIESVETSSTIPKGWRHIKLGNAIENPAYGTSKKCSYESGGLGVLRIPNVVNGAIDAADLKFAEFTSDEMASYELKAGDLLMIRSNGSVSIVGRCALIEPKHTGFLYAGYLIRLRPIKSVIDPLFLRTQLASLKLRSQIEFSAKSTSGVNNINSKEIQRLIIALPSLPEQQEIVRLLDEQFSVIEENEREIDAALKRSEALRQSILKKAFTGQLVPPACRQAGRTPEEFPQPQPGKWWVYVLKCEDGSFYKGFTDNLPERWRRHLSGTGAKWTQQHPPVELFYWEEHWSEASAVDRERYLKSGSGREWFHREIVEKPHEYEPASVLLERIRAERGKANPAPKSKRARGSI